MKITQTMRGKKLDMGVLMARNEKKIALGNAKMNARGDIIGKNGKVKIRREDFAREYNRANPKAVRQVPLRSIRDETLTYDSPEAARNAALKAQRSNVQPQKVVAQFSSPEEALRAAALQKTKRKIVDSD